MSQNSPPPIMQVSAMVLGAIGVVVGVHQHSYGYALGGLAIATLAGLYWGQRD